MELCTICDDVDTICTEGAATGCVVVVKEGAVVGMAPSVVGAWELDGAAMGILTGGFKGSFTGGSIGGPASIWSNVSN